MDANAEDRIVHQIERNLSNQINENLFATGRVFENKTGSEQDKPALEGPFRVREGRNSQAIKDLTVRGREDMQRMAARDKEDMLRMAGRNKEDMLGITDRDREEDQPAFPPLSRAELIRQAREACLRQMNAGPAILKGSAMEENELLHPALAPKKKQKEESVYRSAAEEDSALEVAAYRSLIIRSICAVMIFLSIFLIDKFKMKFGDFSFQTVEELFRGKDTLAALEDLIVSWLK